MKYKSLNIVVFVCLLILTYLPLEFLLKKIIPPTTPAIKMLTVIGTTIATTGTPGDFGPIINNNQLSRKSNIHDFKLKGSEGKQDYLVRLLCVMGIYSEVHFHHTELR